MHKIDLNTERSKEQWLKLLDSIKLADRDTLSKDEQDYYIKEVEYKLGIRNKRVEILKEIQDSTPDYDDIMGY